jgi:hypothetical protein
MNRFPLFLSSFILSLGALLATPSIHAADPVYPDVSRKDYRDTASLTAADWVGPDGVVYPRWDKAGVEGGIPSTDWPVLGMVPWFPGSRDITDELQKAVDEVGRKVMEEGLKGGVVLLPHGTFTLSRPITMVYDGVVIRGAGNGRPGPGTGVTRLMFAWDRPADDKPWIVIHRFDGKLTKDSLFMVFGEARYRWNNQDDPVQPNRTAKVFGLRLLDEGGKVLQEVKKNRDEVTEQAYYRNWDAKEFEKHIAEKSSIRLQPWVSYEDGSVVEGDVIEVGDIEWNRAPVVGHRRPNRRLGGHAAMRGVFMIIGDQWSHRNNRQHLAEPARRGDTVLVFENDLSLEENGGIVPGDILNVQAENHDAFKKETGGGHPRAQAVTVIQVEGNRVTIDQPLRMSFPAKELGHERVSFTTPSFPIVWVGLEDFILQFPNRYDWFNAFNTTHARNVWLKNIRVDDVGQHAGFMTGVKNGEIRDCEFIGGHWSKSGNSSYVGFGGCHDSLMEGVVGVGQRHGPDFHGGAGNVIRNSRLSGSDLQWHNGYGFEHLVENVKVGDNTFGGSYGRALHTPDTGGEMHSPPGPRNVVWNCDLYGSGGGVHLGGYQQGWIIAYNRIHNERGPALAFRDRQTDHLILGNTLIMEDIFAPVVRHGAQGRGADTPAAERKRAELANANHGIEMIANTIYGSNNVINGGWEENGNTVTPLRRSYANRILPPNHAAPRAVEPPVPSLFEAQRQNPQGMKPTGTPLYNPDSKFASPADQLRKVGDPVVSINFLPTKDLKDNPKEWLPETGEPFADREGGFRYGWEGSVSSGRANRAGSDPGTFLYDTNNLFGDAKSSWLIELPPGKYEVEIGLGDSRLPNFGAHNAYNPNTTYYVIHDILVNGELVKDQDGHMDKYDVHRTIVEVNETTNSRLILKPGPNARVLRIQFVRIYKAQ